MCIQLVLTIAFLAASLGTVTNGKVFDRAYWGAAFFGPVTVTDSIFDQSRYAFLSLFGY